MEFEVMVKFKSKNGTTAIIGSEERLPECRLELSNGVIYDAADLTILYNEESFEFTDMVTGEHQDVGFDEVVNIVTADDEDWY